MKKLNLYFLLFAFLNVFWVYSQTQPIRFILQIDNPRQGFVLRTRILKRDLNLNYTICINADFSTRAYNRSFLFPAINDLTQLKELDFPLKIEHAGQPVVDDNAGEFCYEENYKIYTFFDYKNYDAITVSSCLGYAVLTPFYLKQPTENDFSKGNCSTFKLETFNPEVSNPEENVVYSKTINPYDWQPIPQYDPTIGIQLANIPDLSNYVGNLYLKALKVSSNQIGYLVPVSETLETNIINYQIKPCAPALVGTPVIENLKCFNSDNGSIKLKLERPLVAGERINVIVDKKTGSDVYQQFKNVFVYPVGVTPTPVVGAINVNIDQNNEFTITDLIKSEFTDSYKLYYNSDFINPTTNILTNSTNSASFLFDITSPPKVEYSFVANGTKNILCNGDTTGEIAIQATGGTGHFSYSIDDGVSWFNGTGNNPYVFSGLTANQTVISTTSSTNTATPGPYKVRVRDLNDGVFCESTTGTTQILLTQPTKLELFNEPTNTNGTVDPKSYKSTDGEIKVKIVGGTLTSANPNYIVTVTQTDNATPNSVATNYPLTETYNGSSNVITLSDLSGKKTYVITVTDANGCTFAVSKQIIAPDKIEITFLGSGQILCNGQTATIVGKITGGKLTTQQPYYTVDYLPNNNNGPLQVNLSQGEYTFTLNNQSAGTYGFTAIDGNGIYSDSDISATATPNVNDPYNYTIINKPEIVFDRTSLTTINQLCFGDLSIIDPISVSGGTGAISYQWYKNPTSQTDNGVLISGATNLISPSVLPGLYRLEVKDANNCPKTKDFTINAASQIILTDLTSDDINDPGTSTGQIKGTVSGGSNSNYVYKLTRTDIPNQQQITFSSLPINSLFAGTYSLSVFSDICSETKQFTITQPEAFVITTIQNNGIKCNGENATIVVNVTGGTPRTDAPLGYSFSWTKDDAYINNFESNNGTTSKVTDSYGTFVVTVLDKNNVSRTATFTIANPASISATIDNQTNVTCFGSTNGSVTINSIGGNANYNGSAVTYTYLWEKKNNFGNFDTYSGTTQTLTGLAAGEYRCTVGNTLNCPSTQVLVTINQPTQLSATIDVSPVSNNTSTDGSISVTASGGTPPYQYQINTNGFVPLPATNGNYVFSNLGSNTYTITVKDANNCQISETKIVGTLEPLVSSIIRTNEISCFNGNNGKLKAIISGGRIPYANKKWYKVVGVVETEIAANVDEISGLNAGDYKFIATDLVGTPTSATFTLTQPTDIILNASVSNNVKCLNGNDGIVTINYSGGTPNYNLKITKSPNTIVYNGIVTSSPTILNTLSAGNYTVELKDNKNCTKTASFTITQPATAVSATVLSVVDVTQFGASTGAINITITGGTPSYTYEWFKLDVNLVGVSTGITTQNLVNVAAGIYYVVIKDANLCTIQLSDIPITQPSAALTATFTITQPNCFGGKGSVTANPSGGTPNYTYVWSKVSDPDNTIGSGSTLSNILSGDYTVKIKDINQIEITLTVTLTQPTDISATITTTNLTCGSSSGSTSGSITVVATGGSGGYTYQWLDSVNNSQSIRTGLAAGTYNLIITDSKGCPKQFPGISVNINGGINLNGIKTDISCNGESNGSIILNPTRNSVAIPPSQYSFVTTGANAITSLNSTNLAAGTYTGKIRITNPTDNSTCEIDLSYTISEPQPIANLNIVDSTLNLCGGSGMTYNIASQNPIAGTTYEWSRVSPNAAVLSTNSTFTLSTSGVYKAKVTLPNGCFKEKTITITQNSNATIDASFLIASQTFKNEEIILVNVSNDQNSTFSWIFPPTSSSFQVIQNTPALAVIKMTEVGNYKIKLKAKNSLGCEVIEERDVFVENNPNPNGAISSSGILIKNFIISPNPMLSNSPGPYGELRVLVELANSLPIDVSVFSIADGTRILTQRFPNPSTVHNLTFSLAGQASGTYFVVLTTPGSIQAKKLIKQ